MSAIRKLVVKDGRWQVEALPPVEPPSGGVLINVDGILVPPESDSDGFWVGHSNRSPDVRFVGWGLAVDKISIPEGEMQTAPHGYDDSLSAALFLPARAIALALEPFNPPLGVGVAGSGLLACLARDILAHRGFTLKDVMMDADLDLLVDTDGNPALWPRSLPALRAHGTLLLFVPPWSRPVSFDFYPQIHRRSLQVVVKRWHCRPSSSTSASLEYLPPIVSRAVSAGQWLRPMDIEGAASQSNVWHWLSWEQC